MQPFSPFGWFILSGLDRWKASNRRISILRRWPWSEIVLLTLTVSIRLWCAWFYCRAWPVRGAVALYVLGDRLDTSCGTAMPPSSYLCAPTKRLGWFNWWGLADQKPPCGKTTASVSKLKTTAIKEGLKPLPRPPGYVWEYLEKSYRIIMPGVSLSEA